MSLEGSNLGNAEKTLKNVTKTLENFVDNELDRLNNLDTNDIEQLRAQRIKQLKAEAEQKKKWLANGHGAYAELPDGEALFSVCKISNVVCHFYKNGTPRCDIFDHHLKIIASKHIEAKFCKINVEKYPRLAQVFQVKFIPTLLVFVDHKVADKLVGFEDLGSRDDFETKLLEWRLGRTAVIKYDDDLETPPVRKGAGKTIRRGGDDSDDSDF